MADVRAKRIADLIKPLRVKPGSKVNLAKDFDPGYKADFLKKKDGIELLRTGIALLADYQRRLAAQDSYGVLVCLQALDAGGKDGDDPPCHERGEPAGRAGERLQGALG
jgi:polyphosphate kinase 2 (PPK2 family)